MTTANMLRIKKELQIILSGILAGVSIAIGGTVSLMVENRIVSAVMFCVGLFIVCSFQFDLFTGRVSSLLRSRSLVYAANLVLIWIGNWIGAFCVAKIEGFTRTGTLLHEKAAALSAVKTGDSLLSLFILGILCNIMIYVAVTGFMRIDNSVGSYLSIFFGVTVFILCGFEHCVADMYYFSLADMWSNPRAWMCIGAITIGNAVGGVAFDAAATR